MALDPEVLARLNAGEGRQAPTTATPTPTGPGFYSAVNRELLSRVNSRGDFANPGVIADLGALQATLETGHGKSQVGNNYFGIKDTDGLNSVNAATQEQVGGQLVGTRANFEAYGSLGESAGGYLDFIKDNPRYEGVRNAKTIDEAIEAIGASGYATDTEYANKLRQIYSSRRPAPVSADVIARLNAGGGASAPPAAAPMAESMGTAGPVGFSPPTPNVPVARSPIVQKFENVADKATAFAEKQGPLAKDFLVGLGREGKKQATNFEAAIYGDGREFKQDVERNAKQFVGTLATLGNSLATTMMRFTPNEGDIYAPPELQGLAMNSPRREGEILDMGNRFNRAINENLMPKDPNEMDKLVQGVASAAGIMAPTIMLGGVGPGVGRLAAYLNMTPAVLIESVMETQDVALELRDKNPQMPIEEINRRTSTVFWQNAALIIATDSVFPAPLRRMAKAFVAAPSEGLQEGLQAVIQNNALGRPLDTGIADGVILGMLLGGGMGAAMPGAAPSQTTQPGPTESPGIAPLQTTPAQAEAAQPIRRPAPVARPGQEFVMDSAIAPTTRRGAAPDPAAPERLSLAPVEGEPVTQPMSKFLNSEVNALDMLREIRRNPDSIKIQTDVVKQIASGEISDTNHYLAEIVTPLRFMQGVGGGKLNSPVEKATQRVQEMAELVTIKVKADAKGEALEILERSGIGRKSADEKALGEMMVALDRGNLEAAEVALGRAEGPAVVEAVATELRSSFDVGQKILNEVSETFDQKSVGYRENYVPREEKRASFRNPLKRLEQATRPARSVDSGPSKNPRVFNPREQRSTGRAMEQETDIRRLIESYSNDLGRRVGNTIALNAGENVAVAFESAGHTSAARGIRKITQASFNGRRFGISGAIDNTLRSTRPGMAAFNSAAFLKQQFNKAKYTVNVPFMLLRQWTSSGLVTAHGDVTPAMFTRAIGKMWTPGAKARYLDTHAGQIKSATRGSITKEGQTGDILSADTLTPKNALRVKARAVAEKPVNFMEEMTGRFSSEMADQISAKNGWTGKQANDFRSDMIAKTQSIYQGSGRAAVLRSPVLNILFPAQSFGVEGINTLLEINHSGVGLKVYTTPGQKAAATARVTGTMFLLNMIAQYTNGYEDKPADVAKETGLSTAASLVPYVPQLAGSGPSEGRVYPLTLAKETAKALAHIWNGDIERGFSDIAKNLISGGAQFDRISDTGRMIEQDILTEEERFQGSMLGWWTTESGKAYLRDVLRYEGDEPPTPPPAPSGVPVRQRVPRPKTTAPVRIPIRRDQ